MKLLSTDLPGVLIVETSVFGDDRGWFMESFNEARWTVRRWATASRGSRTRTSWPPAWADGLAVQNARSRSTCIRYWP